ncbi:hypothetical protein B6F84_08780 [Acidianus manzaensis]|uniref:Uncharacterized protein n=2 Tax=Acidianus manzaensis TaxID=282676 RepID=A0A1W6K0T3_9CREN|nr:hypothetical protein B6F84_08780 [Acidianus manzaensis]
MTDLLKLDWDNVEDMIKSVLEDKIRVYDYFNYFIIDSEHILVKIYEEDKEIFTVKMELRIGKLEVVEVS